MREANKSAAISAFIYPGAGHFYLKRKIVASILAVIASWALFIVIGNIISRAVDISNKIMSGQVPADIGVIHQLILQPQQEAVAEKLSIAMTTLIIVWIVGIIDSYRLGRVKDRQDQRNGKKAKEG